MNSLADMSGSDLWTYLSHTDKPIVMYGMGNGADKILSFFDKYNVSVADFFASDGFVRGHSFHGFKILSFSEIRDKYTDFVIVISFASNKPDVIDMLSKKAVTDIGKEKCDNLLPSSNIKIINKKLKDFE